MLHTKDLVNLPTGSGEDILKGLYHIWAWQPSWSCDLYHVKKINFIVPKTCAYKIWFKMMDQWCLGKASFIFICK